MEKIPVKEIMTRNVVFVNPYTGLSELLSLFKKTNYKCFPVVEDDKLIGVVTLEDVLNIFHPHKQVIDKYKRMMAFYYEVEENNVFDMEVTQELFLLVVVQDIMQFDPITITEDEIIEHAYHIIKENNLSLLPVVDKRGKLAGVVSLFDIIFFLLNQRKAN